MNVRHLLAASHALEWIKDDRYLARHAYRTLNHTPPTQA